jgi:cytochrome oxidase Cu insertion factor (SCO1/SenC/PrrC family)
VGANKRIIVGGIVFSVVLMLTVSVLLFRSEIARIREAKATRASIMGEIPDFSLVNQAGMMIGRSDLLGRVNLVSFVYTRCTGPCPTLSKQMAQLYSDWVTLPDIQFVTITVDPDFDQPDVLAVYAQRYGADPERWHFLTGERARVYDLVRNGFRASIEDSDTPHEILHSQRFALVDRKGRIRAYLDGESEDLRTAVRPVLKRLLAEN